MESSMRGGRDRTFAGRLFGASRGLFPSDGSVRPLLADIVPSAAGFVSSRQRRIVFDGRRLHNGYDMGVDSSHQRRGWLERTADGMRMSYPASQDWGAVFIIVGRPVDPPRPWRSFTGFRRT
jgi:hypothetical protein